MIACYTMYSNISHFAELITSQGNVEDIVYLFYIFKQDYHYQMMTKPYKQEMVCKH